ncbi:MAG TPA: hypothetical protein VF471_15680 [Pseudoxanthomonas sp.]
MTTPESRQASDKPAALTFADLPPGLAEGQTPLETLLNLLQGGSPCALADAGIAARDPQTLDRISAAAELESDECLDRIHCLLELLQATLTTDPPALSQITLIGALRHLTRFLTDHQRWHVLADNAAYYRDHPEVANRIATCHTP